MSHPLLDRAARWTSGVAQAVQAGTDQARRASVRAVWVPGDWTSGDTAAAVAVQDIRRHGGRARVSALEVFVDGYNRAIVPILRRRHTGGVLRPPGVAVFK